MGRQKSVPAKKNPKEQWNLMPINYIPVKKRSNKKRKGTITTYNVTLLSEEHKPYHLGEICIGNTSNALPETWTSCKASFISTEANGEHLALELGSVTVVVTALLDADLIKDIITSKVFAVHVFTANEDVYFDLYFVNLPLPKFTKKIAGCVQTLMSMLFHVFKDSEIENCDVDLSSSHAISQFYKDIKTLRERELTLKCDHVQHYRLKPKLRPYQADAVRWMLHREKIAIRVEDELHPLYTLITLKSGLVVYYDKHSGYIEVNKPNVDKSSKGGILADEMGLGKTVEVLACILLHQKPNDRDEDCCCLESDVNLKNSPFVDRIPRKRRTFEDLIADLLFVDKSKKLPVPAKRPKSNGKKSQTRVALEMWYNRCLQDVTKSTTPRTEEIILQCICGGNGEEDRVECEDCGKIQHGNCLGYRKKYGPYKCPQCWMNQPIIECGATLIVSPVSLRTQWCNEICKHIKGDFNVLQYGGSSLKAIYPTKLLKYDVVVTTYNVLQSELRLTESGKEMSFRNQRRYSPPGSPLTRVKWWRLCLDEAQAVEAPTSMVSTMAQKLNAHFRWAVTGTPISKEISDLQGLIDYLQIEPYNDKFTWDNVLFNPYLKGQTEPLHKFLSNVLWRSSKDEVIDQINLPQQTVKEYWLQFSAVEQYFYKCEHQACSDAFLSKIRLHDSNTLLQTLDKSSLKLVLAPLLSLRQVCTYPNSIRTRYLATKKPVHSMKDLLKALIVKNTNECEEFLRIVLSSLNGLAGIYLLLQNIEQAIDEYRTVLQLYTRFTEEEKIVKLAVDKLQVIHTMHNLSEVLELCPNVAKTLRDETLSKDCAELEQKYIERFITQSMSAVQECLLINVTVEKLRNNFTLQAGKWYSDLLDWITIHDYTEELCTKIETAHSTTGLESTLNFRNTRSLVYVISIWDDAISSLRQDTIDVISQLYTHNPENELQISVSRELVKKATECHLKSQKKGKSKRKCPVCVANDHLKSYELKLFCMTKRSTYFEEMSLIGSWKPTTEELIFKSILAVGRVKNAQNELIKDGETHITLLETLKKEFKEIRKLWTFIDQQVCAQDELDMCKIRLRLKEPNEEENHPRKNQMLKNLTYNLENKLETIHVLGEHELEYQRTVLHSEENSHMARLEKNLGIRSYLETLHKQQYEGQSPDPCPICKNSLQQHWSITPCGHSYCLDCIQILIEQTRGHHVQCSVCREYHKVADISYIKVGEQLNEPDSVNIKGNYSTKVESIIKLILELKTEDKDVKILIFSYWVSVLNYIKSGLVNNNISHLLVGAGNLENQIETFKDPKEGITILLLPIQLGGKGLNLIEATHVILTEPLLNSGDELQAIGRVHRIGQTKPTVVHKFYIKNTIEESIQKAISTDAHKWQENEITLNELTNLFLTNENPRDENVEFVSEENTENNHSTLP